MSKKRKTSEVTQDSADFSNFERIENNDGTILLVPSSSVDPNLPLLSDGDDEFDHILAGTMEYQLISDDEVLENEEIEEENEEIEGVDVSLFYRLIMYLNF